MNVILPYKSFVSSRILLYFPNVTIFHINFSVHFIPYFILHYK